MKSTNGNNFVVGIVDNDSQKLLGFFVADDENPTNRIRLAWKIVPDRIDRELETISAAWENISTFKIEINSRNEIVSDESDRNPCGNQFRPE